MDFKDLRDADFERYVAETLPLLVVFRTEGSKLCDNVEAWLKQLDYESKLTLGRMDVDANNKPKDLLGILSVPNMVLFKGSMQRRSGWIGPWSRAKVQDFVKKHLSS